MFVLLDKSNRISLVVIDPAMEGVPSYIDIHRRRMVLVKRTEADIAVALFHDAVSAKLRLNHLEDRSFGGNLFEDIPGRSHWTYST